MTSKYVLSCPGYTSKLHEIGLIQDIGYIMAVQLGDDNIYRVTDVSNNIIKASWIVQKDLSEILNHTLGEVFINAKVNNSVQLLLRRHQSIYTSSSAANSRGFQLLPVLCKGNHIQVENTFVCCSVVDCNNRKNSYILEFEELEDEALTNDSAECIPNNRILQSGDTIARIRSANSIETVTAAFIDSVMEILPDYDRGMVYRFCDDDSGEVIYEHLKDPNQLQSSYMNMRFPAADIPLQVRPFFVKNGFRIITDTSGIDSKIISVDDIPLDLTMCVFRAPHECHKQYLRNMGVKASLNVAIVVDNKLWGLHCFHAYFKNVKPSVEQRICLEMIGSIASMRVKSYILQHCSDRKLTLNQLFMTLQNIKNVKEFLQVHAVTLLKVVEADTFVLYYEDGRRLLCGDESMYLTEQGYEKLKNLSNINELLPINTFTEGLTGLGAGVIFYKHQNVNMAFIRRSKITDVRWGGKEDHCLDPNDRLHPRASFDMYVEKARQESINWSSADCDLTKYVFDQIIQYLHSEMLAATRLSLDQSNAECLQVIQSSKENYEFFAHMSHELRTPFHGVISSLQILQSGHELLKAEERKEIVDSALECGKTMLRTLNDILTIAKNKNHIDVAQNSFFVSKVVDATRHVMSPMAECRALRFSCKIGTVKLGKQQVPDSEVREFAVIGDDTRIGQVTNNLTNNAIKFTPPGGAVTVKASVLSSVSDVMQLWETESSQFENKYVYEGQFATTPSTTATAYFTFSVQDSGCGIPGSDLSTVFDAYKQVSSGVTKTYQGTGLGLHIVQLHIDAMGGMIAVASTTKVGTIFFFAVPILVAVDESPLNMENLKSAIPSVVETTNTTQPETVVQETKPIKMDSIFLLVDDSQINLRLAKRKIQLALGDEVTIQTAEDGIEAIEAVTNFINTGKYHLLKGIFMDYHMPRCSGLEAIVAIRRIEKENPDVSPCHIIAFTADLSEESQKVLIGAGANEVMAKPTPAGLMEEACLKLATK